jgi:hypothetical protein
MNVTTARLWSGSIEWSITFAPDADAIASTILSTTSGRRPSLKLGTHWITFAKLTPWVLGHV